MNVVSMPAQQHHLERPQSGGPVAQRERIVAMDVIRGVAVLGILLMNIQFFSMPGAAYSNPTAYGNLEGINLAVWAFSYLFAEMKFISLFSLLFGAGIVLMLERAEARGETQPIALHLRRMGWLLLFGLIHAYALWAGDILVTYALCGMLFVLLRKAKARTLLVLGVALVSVCFLINLASGLSLPFWIDEARDEMQDSWKPSAETIAKEVAAYRGNWLEQMPRRAEDAFFMQLPLLFLFSLWRVGGMMLIGMALLKNGFLRGEWQDASYFRLAALTGTAGLLLACCGIWQNFAHGWALEYSFFLGIQWNYWGSFLMCLCYASLGVLAVKRGWALSVQRRFAAVGRMAFSNYILETLLCTLVLYGHGLGLYGSLERWQQLLLTLGVWTVILLLSPWWLARHRYGPLEYLWRRLTYGARRIRPESNEAVSAAEA